MAARNVSRLRGIGPLLRIITFVLAAITAILLGAAHAVARKDSENFYGEGWIAAVTLSFVSGHQLDLEPYDYDLTQTAILFRYLVRSCAVSSLLPRIVSSRHRYWVRLSWMGR